MNRLRSGWRFCTGWLCIALLALSASAATGSAAPAQIARELGAPRLSGAGSFHWFGLKIYDAQLWVSDAGEPDRQRMQADPFADRLFALDLHYARALQGARIAAASRDEIQRLGFGTPEQRAAWFTKMEKLFPDVHADDHITGIYLPGQGARFYLNGAPLGEIADAGFGRAFFAIWLDPRSSAEKLRSALLQNLAQPR